MTMITKVCSVTIAENFVALGYLIESADNAYELSDMRVRRTYRVNVPQSLIINSCNLQLNEPVGQGTNTRPVIYTIIDEHASSLV